eukprot:gene8806-9747_t
MKRKAPERFDGLGPVLLASQSSEKPSKCKRANCPSSVPYSEKEKVNSPSFQRNCEFNLLPIEKFDNSFPYYREPFEIGAFSIDDNRQFHNNRSKLRMYNPPLTNTLNYDLKIGYKEFKARDDTKPEKLDHLLKWVHLHRDKFCIPGQSNEPSHLKKQKGSLNTDFITWRGHLVKILCTPYETREPWQMNACKHNGTIFISEVQTEAMRRQKISETEKQKQMCYWGYKFEDYTTKPFGKKSDDQNTSLKPENAGKCGLNNSEAFCSVVRSRLNKHSVVIGAEVDCCELQNGKYKAPASYIELKTSRIMEFHRQRRNFSMFKLKKFWAQSYLAGVPKIICGMRDDDGIVKSLDTYKTLDIPNIANSNNATWSAAVCMNFLDLFLQWVKEMVVKDNPHVVYAFKFEEPFKTVSVEELGSGSSKEMILPDWFLSENT